MEKRPQEIIDKFSVAGQLWVEVVKRALNDLNLSSRAKLSVEEYRATVHAACYFFLEPQLEDVADMRTFVGLCNAIGLNADAAAEAIWRRMASEQQHLALMMLRDLGYNPKI